MSEENLRTVYQELCNSYHAVDDFRAKLMGFLPFATGAGIFLLITEKEKLEFARQFLFPIGVFGFAVTLGLFAYELYGIKKCHHLIKTGIALEGELMVRNGQFRQRPREVFRIVNEPFAAGIIYSAVLAAWAFLVAISTWPQATPAYAPQVAQGWAICIFIFSFSCSFYFNRWLTLKDEVENALQDEVENALKPARREVSIKDVIAYLKIKHARLPEIEKNKKMSELKRRLQLPALCHEQVAA